MKLTKSFTLFVFLLLTATTCLAQKDFQNGYYITKSGEKIEGLILNENWKKNPLNFKYKASAEDEISTLGVNQVKEFSVKDEFKYLGRNVQIDYSPESRSRLTPNDQPEYKRANVFIKVLVEGLVNLYEYEGNGVNSFFFSKVDNVIMPSIHEKSIVGGEIIPLVYKEYLGPGNTIKENNTYKQLLYKYVSDCENLTRLDMRNLSYSSRSLSNLLINYNECKGAAHKDFNKEKKKALFNLNLNAGMYFSDIEITRNDSFANADTPDFGTTSGARYGVEVEIILPTKGYNWGVFLGYYRKSNVKKTIPFKLFESDPNDRNATLLYESSEIVGGVRNYINLSDDFKVSLNFGYIFDTRSKLLIEFDTRPDLTDNRGDGYIFGGVGLHYKNFSIIGTSNFNKKFFRDSGSFDSNISDFNITAAYTIYLNH